MNDLPFAPRLLMKVPAVPLVLCGISLASVLSVNAIAGTVPEEVGRRWDERGVYRPPLIQSLNRTVNRLQTLNQSCLALRGVGVGVSSARGVIQILVLQFARVVKAT